MLDGARDAPIPLAQEVHLWFASVSETVDVSFVDRYLELMSPYERERYVRLVSPQDRNRYAVTRALVRNVLSRYADVAPERWIFVEGPYGRPELAPNEGQRAFGLQFNISHVRDQVVVAVVLCRRVGVDIESMARRISFNVAKRHFSPAEVDDLLSMPIEYQQKRFLELWTLKESYVKARGMGFYLPLSKFSFTFKSAGILGFGCDHSIETSPERWVFVLMEVNENYLVAICVERIFAMQMDIVCRRVTPLGDVQRMHGQVTYHYPGFFGVGLA